MKDKKEAYLQRKREKAEEAPAATGSSRSLSAQCGDQNWQARKANEAIEKTEEAEANLK